MGYYNDLFKLNITDKNLEKFCAKYFQKIDVNNPNEKLLGLAYYYARQKHLKDYQARSFASELTAFLTNELYDTDVSLVYREEWLDSYLFKKMKQCDSLNNFINYMIKFYKSSKSWKYERVGKYLQFRITEREKEMFDMIPEKRQIDKFNWLLRNYDYTIENSEFNRGLGVPSNKIFGINICTSQYECFMSVAGETKTNKFLNLLYYGYVKLMGGIIK